MPGEHPLASLAVVELLHPEVLNRGDHEDRTGLGVARARPESLAHERDRLVDLVILDSDEEGCVSALEEAADGVDAGDAIALGDQSVGDAPGRAIIED